MSRAKGIVVTCDICDTQEFLEDFFNMAEVDYNARGWYSIYHGNVRRDLCKKCHCKWDAQNRVFLKIVSEVE